MKCPQPGDSVLVGGDPRSELRADQTGAFFVDEQQCCAAKSNKPPDCASVGKCTKKPWELAGSAGTMAGAGGSQNGWDKPSMEDDFMTNQNNQSGNQSGQNNQNPKQQNQPQSGQQAGQQQRQQGQQDKDNNQKSGQQGNDQQNKQR
jgi:hypothetical protein